MRKKGFLLQLFAEEGATGGENATGEGGTGEGTNASSGSSQNDGDDDQSGGSKGESSKAKYTDEDVDRMFARKFAEWKKAQEKEVAKAREAEKFANMTEQQKAMHELKELKKIVEGYEKEKSLSEMTKTARKILSDEGINVSDELLGMIVSDSAEDTKAAVDSFKEAFNSAVEKAIKERLKGEAPSRGSGSNNSGMTKEQIMAIKNPELRQKAIKENSHLFNFKRGGS